MQRILFALTLLCSLSFYGQNNAVSAGEKLLFTASYNISGILTDLAEVSMETSEVKTSKTTLLRLKCSAATYSQWDGFFKIRDLYESYVSPTTLIPYLYKRDINEGSYYKFMKYTYNHKDNTVNTLQRKKKKGGDTWDENKIITIKSGTRDIVSSLYTIRTFNFKNMAVGNSKKFIIVIDREEIMASVTLLGKEFLQTNIGKKECYKLAIAASKTDVLKGQNSNLLWLTADENKVPVYARFKIAVGNGELKLKSASGLRN